MAAKKASAKKTNPETGREEVEAYLAQVPEPARTTLEKTRAMIRAAAPKDASEAISYKIPSFQYKGGLVWYAAFKNHCSFFPMDHSLEEEFAEELKKYNVSKGTIQFPVDKPLPKALVARIVKARVTLNEVKARDQ
ncbi:MAG: iron chaperone [Terracidiphilus sp.]